VLMEKIMSYGAIPIAKTVLGTFASGMARFGSGRKPKTQFWVADTVRSRPAQRL
jgi:hypothetical protein